MKAKPGDVCDFRGIPIYPGDLLKSFHFVGPRRRRYYLYHVAIWREDHQRMEGVPVAELEPTRRGKGGRFWLSQSVIDAMEGEIIQGSGPGDCVDYLDRPRVKADRPPA